MILEDLYKTLYSDEANRKSNLEELASLLSDIAFRQKPWSGKYLSNILEDRKGFNLSKQLEKACKILAARLDNQSPLQPLITREIKAYSINGHIPDGVIILAEAAICPVCQVRFIKKVHNHKYCTLICRRSK